MNRGRHAAADSGTSFYRQLTMMIVGILLVGAAVFLLLYLFAGDPDPVAGETTVPTTTSSSVIGSSGPSSTNTTAPAVTTTAPANSTTTVPVRSPQEVRVIVLNSIGLDGAGGRMTQQLADAGYQTQQADDLEPQQDSSRLWFREGFAAEANALLAFLPGALVEPIPDPEMGAGADVVLVLGSGYTE